MAPGQLGSTEGGVPALARRGQDRRHGTRAAHEALGAGRSRRGGRGEDGHSRHGELWVGTGLSVEDGMHWLPMTSSTSSFLSGFPFLVDFEGSCCVSSIPANRMWAPWEEGSDGLIQCWIPRPEKQPMPSRFLGTARGLPGGRFSILLRT